MHARIHSLPVHLAQQPINCTGFQFGHKSHASDFSSGKGRGEKKQFLMVSLDGSECDIKVCFDMPALLCLEALKDLF